MMQNSSCGYHWGILQRRIKTPRPTIVLVSGLQLLFLLPCFLSLDHKAVQIRSRQANHPTIRRYQPASEPYASSSDQSPAPYAATRKSMACFTVYVAMNALRTMYYDEFDSLAHCLSPHHAA